MGANEWRDEDEWPLARAERRSCFLAGRAADGDGASDRRAADSPPDRFEFDPMDPVPTHGGAHLVLGSHHLQGPVDQRDIEVRADVLSYTSDELSADLEVTGWVTCELWVTLDGPVHRLHRPAVRRAPRRTVDLGVRRHPPGHADARRGHAACRSRSAPRRSSSGVGTGCASRSRAATAPASTSTRTPAAAPTTRPQPVVADAARVPRPEAAVAPRPARGPVLSRRDPRLPSHPGGG